MITKVFSVYDIAAAVFMPVFLARTEGEAVRSVLGAARDKQPGNMLSEYPDQFVLMVLGTFDDNTGVITPDPAHKSLGPVSGLLRVGEKATRDREPAEHIGE